VVTGAGGGIDKTVLNSPRFLENSGYDTYCAYMRHPQDAEFAHLRTKAIECNAPLCEVDDRGPWDYRVIKDLLRLCRELRVAVWHAHEYKSNLIGVLLRRRWPMKLVSTVHGWGARQGRTPLYHALDRFTLRHYDRVICVSSDLMAKCRSMGISEERLELIENAIDTEQFRRSKSRQTAKAKLGIDPDRVVIGAVGRLAAEKAFHILIGAVHELLGAGLDVELVVAGEGEEQLRLQRLIAELGIGDRVRLLGYRPDVIEVFEALDVFVLSSLSEGMPNVVLEAMALEVPVVATRITSLPSVIRHERDGLLVAPGKQAELTAALRRLATDESFREMLRRAGRQRVDDRYSFRRRMERIKSVYDAVLAIGPESGVFNSTQDPTQAIWHRMI
jgi:glycosyltransferase involved in cell wall biosynthesis